MSIERYAGVYIAKCDVCGSELLDEYSFEDAVNGMKSHGWMSVIDSSGDWWNLCPKCREMCADKLKKPNPSEFRGVRL